VGFSDIGWGRVPLIRALFVVAFFWVPAIVGCSSRHADVTTGSKEKADHIVVEKSQHTLTLMTKGRVLKEYKVALGRDTGRRTTWEITRLPKAYM
jgi:hypothetical protein